jgi:L-serine deaminase
VLQVNVGVAPDHAMDRETHTISQTHAAVNEARTQSVEVQQQTQDHVRNIEIQTQVSVEGANARALAVESRAHDLLTELQTRHQSEINQLQNVANESHHESQQRLLKARAENQRLLDWIKDQKNKLEAQWHEQKEFRSVIMGLLLS